MIVIRNRPNVLMIPVKTGSGVAEDSGQNTVYIYPGMNGSVPESIKEHPMFKEQVEEGYLQVVESKAKPEDGIEEQTNVKIDEVDQEVIVTVINSPSKEAVKLVRQIFKLVDLEAIENKESRAAVITAINAQKKALGFSK